MSLTPAELASGLLEKGAVKVAPVEPFTWSSGLKAPIYCDNRQLLGDAALRGRIADALAAATTLFKPSLVAGTSTAGIPWGALVADRLNLPFAYVRPEPKKHGMGRQVEGPNAAGQSVVLIEDLISTGGSSLKCVDALKVEGAQVHAVLALFSYGLPAAVNAFHAADTTLVTLATFEALVGEARRLNLVDMAGAESLKAWQRDALSWSKSHGGV